ncbi:MAG: MBL fold metallo-hydrolase [Polyangiaceae bacterium]
MQPRELSRAVSWVGAKTPTLPPATHTNSYALGTREVLLVEPATPYEDEQREWLAWARGLSSEGRRPIAIVVTHHHPDHVGGAEALARALGLPLWAHEATLARLPFLAHGGIATRALHDGERLVLDGASPEAWEVLHTPGHATGHVCLFDRRARVAVVGDMVASVGQSSSLLVRVKDTWPRTWWLARLESLDAAVALRRTAIPSTNRARSSSLPSASSEARGQDRRRARRCGGARRRERRGALADRVRRHTDDRVADRSTGASPRTSRSSSKKVACAQPTVATCA